MQKIIFLLTIASVLFLYSCKDKNRLLLCKKWDCVKIENLAPLNQPFQSHEDSVTSIKIETALKALNWTFSENGQYSCSIGDRITISGSYQLIDNGKTLVCTPVSKNNINTYTVGALTDNDMVLSNHTAGANIIMHFKPH